MTDLQFMRRAIRLARRGEGHVEPNPMVGCVVVRDGEILGAGHHAVYGGPHAEIAALDACRRDGHDLAGATVYVTLEPCCHTGKTPPCTDALIAADVARVVVALVDPATHADGRGVESLRRAGIDVEVCPESEEARRLAEPYVKRVTTGLPWIIAKWAQTLDGHIASRTGDSRWISSTSSRQLVHRLRARVDAVAVGIGTVLADDPRLTARRVRVRRHARRVVIDPRLRIPDNARLLTEPSVPLTIAVGAGADPHRVQHLRARRGIEIFTLPPTRGGRGSLRPLLEHLATAHGATNVLVEGGGGLLGSLLAEDLIDQYLVFTAPIVLGDAEAVTAVRGSAVPRIEEGTRLHLAGMRRIEGDVLLDYRRAHA